MVESSTYRQSAAATPEKREKDPHNRLLSRGPRFRMDGEMIRDAALSCSGLLVGTLGGPSVKPYQPEGVWEAVAMPESNTHFYRPDHGDRSVSPQPLHLLEAERAAGLAGCLQRSHPRDLHHPPRADQHAAPGPRDPQRPAVRRGGPRTGATSPQARWPDRRSSASTSSPGSLLARPFRPEEQAIVQASLARLNAYYQSHPDEAAQLLAVGESKVDPSLDPATLAAWTMLANELMNLDEFLNK